MKLNVTPAEAFAILEEEQACESAPGVYDEARFMREKFGIRQQFPPQEYRLVVRRDVVAIPCVGVERNRTVTSEPLEMARCRYCGERGIRRGLIGGRCTFCGSHGTLRWLQEQKRAASERMWKAALGEEEA